MMTGIILSSLAVNSFATILRPCPKCDQQKKELTVQWGSHETKALLRLGLMWVHLQMKNISNITTNYNVGHHNDSASGVIFRRNSTLRQDLHQTQEEKEPTSCSGMVDLFNQQQSHVKFLVVMF